MQHTGVKISGWITSDFPIKDINPDTFIDEFIEWIESKGYQFCGTSAPYEYDSEE